MDEGSPCAARHGLSRLPRNRCATALSRAVALGDRCATELTRAFTGRPARALRNRFVADMADAEVLGFPLQASVVAPLWQAADETARAQLTPFWAGQAAALTREAPAAEVVEKLVAEAQAALSRSR